MSDNLLLPPTDEAKKVFAKVLENNPGADMRPVPNEWLLNERARCQKIVDDFEAELARERERVAELEAVLQAAVDDLLLRGRKDPDGTTVVNIGFSVWLQMRKALAPPTDTTGGE